MDTNLKHTLQSVVDKCKLIFQPVTTNGYAELNEYGYVKTSQLPGFVDDIIEGYYNSIDGKFYTTESYTSEIIPEVGKIYVSIDSNKTYRWSSSSYVVISETIALGETSSTAFAGDKGKANSEAITTLQTSILNKLDKTMNLSDVQNRQIAANNLLNASSSNAEKFVYVNANGNVDFVEKISLTAGVYSNEVSSHGHRHDYYNSQTPYCPIMKIRHLNSMNKFQIDFTIMSVDTTASTNPSFIAKYTFFRTVAFSPEGKLVCNYYSTTNKEGFSYEDVIAVPSVEGDVSYTTFYKKTKSEFDWYCYIIHSISKYSIDGLSGYIVPTYYIGSRDTPAKIAEVVLNGSMYKSASEFSEIWSPIQTEYSQHIFGKYNNVEDEYEQNYIEIAGNGTGDTTRSNARTLDWGGNEMLAGNLTIGGTITANGGQILPQKQADWNQNDSAAVDYIKNKPVIPTPTEPIPVKSGTGTDSVIIGDVDQNKATGDYSVAEGNGTTASGENSHAEGNFTTASGMVSHAEGTGTTATGDYSHTEGNGTIANNKCQHVFGEYNGVDPSSTLSSVRGTYIEIVGNGTDKNARSNARTLDWQGNEILAGNLTIGGTITANGGQILPQKQADWNQTTSTESDYILNKPTKLSDFINDGEGDSPANPFTTIEDVTNRISTHNSDITTHEDIRSSVASHGGRISAVEELIPAQATSSNNLADKEFVNSSISTNTANFKGTYNTLAELEATTADNNDYGFIITTDTSGNTVYNRYKYDGTSWSYEYSLNNSAFTAAQWEAIQSGITSDSVAKLNGIVHEACKVQTDGFTKSSGALAGSLYIWNTPRAAGYYGSPDDMVRIFYPDVKTANGTISADSSGVIDISGQVTGEINSAVGSAIGSLIGEVNLKEPLLPATPEQPESKFLNGNKEWVEIGGGGPTTVYKSITIENPTASENMCIFYAPVAMTITEIRGVITGATSVSFKVVSGTSRNAVTTEHNSSAVVCSSVTTGDVATITTAAVAAGSWVAVKTSAIAGAPSELVITLCLNY